MKWAIVLALSLALTIASTICNPALGKSPGTHKGEIDGAPFRIQIPSEWNGNLVLYAHGYLPRGTSWSPLSDVFCDVFLDRGFALAESGYSRQGWAVAEGFRQTEELRRHFVEEHGEPDSTFVTGHSMGGLIALASVETYPDSYVGALPICGPLVPAVAFFEDPVFDMLVTFEALFGSSLPTEFQPVIEAPKITKEAIESALDSDPEFAERFAFRWDLRREDLPRILALYHTLYRELVDHAGGNPIDNRNTVYPEFQPKGRLNAVVRRYSADPEALDYLVRHYTPTGRIEDPVLAVHTTYDPGVPPRLPSCYDVTVSLMGNEDWFVQKYVVADGHCKVNPYLLGQAFDLLRGWAATGSRPKPGLLR